MLSVIAVTINIDIMLDQNDPLIPVINRILNEDATTLNYGGKKFSFTPSAVKDPTKTKKGEVHQFVVSGDEWNIYSGTVDGKIIGKKIADGNNKNTTWNSIGELKKFLMVGSGKHVQTE